MSNADAPPPPPPSNDWERLASLFWDAEALPPDERAPFVLAHAPDEATRREVLAMLAMAGDDRQLQFERRFVSATEGPGAPLPAGTVVGPYRLEALVGRGGMGEVYRAERVDGALSLTVALKLLRADARVGGVARRFAAERTMLAQLVHPNIASIVDAGSAPDGRPYIALRFVDGVPVTQYTAGRSLEHRLRLFLKVAHAVQFAHARLIVHRDIKPGNILVTGEGQPVLLDFGIAKLLAPTEGATDETSAGDRALTPLYAAPEQVRGDAVTTATDVYALGALLFEILTGRHVFARALDDRGALERATLDTTPPAPSSCSDRADAPQLRGDLDSIVLMALRKEPERRYRSAGDLAADVERYLDGLPVTARPDTWSYRTSRFVRRHRLAVGGLAAGVLALATMVVRERAQAARIARERDRAVAEREAGDAVLSFVTGLFEQSDPRVLPGGDTMRVATFLVRAEAGAPALADQPERLVRLYTTLGTVRNSRGEYAAAESLLSKARRLGDSALGADHLAVLQARHAYATLVRDTHNRDLGRALLDSLVRDLRRVLGADHRELADAYADLAVTLVDADSMRALIDSMIAVRQRAGAGDSVDLASQLDLQALERGKRGRASEAVTLEQAALDIVRRRFPPDHPYVVSVSGNLATWLMEGGAFDSAYVVAQRAWREGAGATREGRARAIALERLALIAVNTPSRRELADSLETEVRATWRSIVPPTHELALSSMRNQAIIRSTRGQDAAGLALLDSAIALARVKPDSLGWLYLIGQRVPMLVRLGRGAEAQLAAERAAHALTGLGAAAPQRAELAHWRGLAAMANGRPTDAVEPFRHAVTLLRDLRRGTNGHPRLAMAECALAGALQRAGRDDEAAPLGDACRRAATWGLVDPTVLSWSNRSAER